MFQLLNPVDRILRGSSCKVPVGLAAVLAGGALYGAVMGAFGGIAGDRIQQVLFSAVKVPLLILVTTALTIPSFYVINTLVGLRADIANVLRAVAATQATV